MIRSFMGHLGSSQFPQLLVNQRQKLFRGCPVTMLDFLDYLCHITHDSRIIFRKMFFLPIEVFAQLGRRNFTRRQNSRRSSARDGALRVEGVAKPEGTPPGNGKMSIPSIHPLDSSPVPSDYANDLEYMR